MTLATSGPNLVLVERFEQFMGKYGLSPLTITNQPTNQPSPKDSGVTPFVITYSATAVGAAKLVKTSFNKLIEKHPNILYKRCVTAFKRGQNLRDLLVRSRLGKAPLDNPTVTGSDSSQDLTTLVNALDEV